LEPEISEALIVTFATDWGIAIEDVRDIMDVEFRLLVSAITLLSTNDSLIVADHFSIKADNSVHVSQECTSSIDRHIICEGYENCVNIVLAWFLGGCWVHGLRIEENQIFFCFN